MKGQETKKAKKYESPKLRAFGSVHNLTGGSAGPHNGDAGIMKF